jgi:hypothetical protein
MVSGVRQTGGRPWCQVSAKRGEDRVGLLPRKRRVGLLPRKRRACVRSKRPLPRQGVRGRAARRRSRRCHRSVGRPRGGVMIALSSRSGPSRSASQVRCSASVLLTLRASFTSKPPPGGSRPAPSEPGPDASSMPWPNSQVKRKCRSLWGLMEAVMPAAWVWRARDLADAASVCDFFQLDSNR